MLGLAMLFGLTMGIVALIDIVILPCVVLKLMVLEMILVMGTGIFLINRRHRYLMTVRKSNIGTLEMKGR